VIPIAAAMALIGWGATLSLLDNRNADKREILATLNLVVYVLLVGLAMGAQTHAAQASIGGRLHWFVWADHLLAAGLLVSLTWLALRRLGFTD